MAEKSPYQVVLKDVRLSFPNLFTARASVEDGPKKFGASFLMDPETKAGKAAIAQCEAALEQLKKDTWKDKASKIRFKEGRICFGEGDELGMSQAGELYDGYEGMMVVRSKNAKRPKCVDKAKDPVDESDDVFYGGCYVNAVIRFYAVTGEKQGGNGIFANLEAVQFKRDGESFGAAPVDTDDVFDDESDEDDEDDLL